MFPIRFVTFCCVLFHLASELRVCPVSLILQTASFLPFPFGRSFRSRSASAHHAMCVALCVMCIKNNHNLLEARTLVLALVLIQVLLLVLVLGHFLILNPNQSPKPKPN